MSSVSVYRWDDPALVAVNRRDDARDLIHAADSLLVSGGYAFAPEMHRARFLDAVRRTVGGPNFSPGEVDAFWAAAFGMIPAKGNWFPRVELRSGPGETGLAFRHRRAPELTRSVKLRTHAGDDPRTVPSLKGPDIVSLGAIRGDAQLRGIDDVVFLTPSDHIIDGAANAIVWWRGDTLCAPPREEGDPAFARVPSVTAKAVLGLAGALGVGTREERARPADLDGTEVWALNALHGIRMVTEWAGVPQLAEKPGRIGVWRERMHALRAPIGGVIP